VSFETKDTRTKRLIETQYATSDFLAALADHIADRYRHNVRYFGVLAPRSKPVFYNTLFASLGQVRRSKPRRLSWATSLQQTFGANPLIDAFGEHLQWVGRLGAQSDSIAL
jgi:Putative transposase